MAIEIERKFLVDLDKWKSADKGAKHLYIQGYILASPEKTIRVRVADDFGFLTIKGASEGAARAEYEYAIPKHDAMELLEGFCSSHVSKYRYTVWVAGKVWEVDEFLGANEGLFVAEIELQSADEAFEMPSWVGEEVTGIERYYNSALSKHPFSEWEGQSLR
jgi:CYTH domain-containing protein